MIRIINLIPMRNQPQRLKPQRLKSIINPATKAQATKAKNINPATKALKTCHKGTKIFFYTHTI
jgi:hypothetical protein